MCAAPPFCRYVVPPCVSIVTVDWGLERVRTVRKTLADLLLGVIVSGEPGISRICRCTQTLAAEPPRSEGKLPQSLIAGEYPTPEFAIFAPSCSTI
jgi:hypothetical protein